MPLRKGRSIVGIGIEFRFAFALLVCLSLGATGWAQAPLKLEDLETLITLGIGEDAIVDKIGKEGVAFSIDDEAIARLRDSGASDPVIEALRRLSAGTPPASSQPPVEYSDVLKLLKLGIGEAAIIERLGRSPTVFTLSPQQIAELQTAGATNTLIAAMESGRPISAAARELITDFAVILDCSGSMREETSDRKSKMEAAKHVVSDLIRSLPEGINLTFVIYGHEAFGANDPRNCDAVKIVRPLSRLDGGGKSSLASLIDQLAPVGATPLARSLRVAGAELAKNDAYCGMVLITDGLETCQGDPVAEAATLARNSKLTFGVSVVGFDVTDAERRTLESIAEAGRGRYYNAASAEELSDRLGELAQELTVVARPAEVVDTSRRALRILSPEIELPAMKEIFLVEANQAESSVYTKTSTIAKYGDYLDIPSSTKAYDVMWVPQTGRAVYLMRNYTLAERRVVDVKPETLLGMIRVRGTGTPRAIFVMPAGEEPRGVYRPISQVANFDELLAVPSGTYDLYITEQGGRTRLIEEGFQVEPGKLYQF